MFKREHVLGFFKSKALVSAFNRVQKSVWNLDLNTLEKNARPTETDRKIKSRLWSLVEESIQCGGEIKLRRLHADICTYTNLFNKILANQYKVAWLLFPSEEIRFKLETDQMQKIEKAYSIVVKPVIGTNGKINFKQAKSLFETMQILFKLDEKL